MADTPLVYIPMDRRQALVSGTTLPDRDRGAGLFADISGFTALTESLVRDLGPQRGAEELTRYLNLVYDALIAQVHLYAGSVVGFSGDAITCWLAGDHGLRAATCALGMQRAMAAFSHVRTPSGQTVALTVKVAVATGTARRFLVGDPDVQVIDVLAGKVLDDLAAGEHLAAKGEVMLDPGTLAALGEQAEIEAWREDEAGRRFGLLAGLAGEAEPCPWPPVGADVLGNATARPWVVRAVYERLSQGKGDFLAELRPAVALFLSFTGLEYDLDDAAGTKLDRFIRDVQRVLERYEGTLIQLTMGDKGSYLYAAFGAPVAHEDDAVRAANAALDLRTLDCAPITGIKIGISRGRMRTGAYGSFDQRTYGSLGSETNIAARLMQRAEPNQVLASKYVYQAAKDDFSWRNLGEIKVKGKEIPIGIYGLDGPRTQPSVRFDETRYTLPMVGRAAELAEAAARLDHVMARRGQILGITAEAGMGKSRLTAEIIRLAGERSLAIFGGECVSYGTNSSYLVWQSVWRSFFKLDSNWDADRQIEAAGRVLASIDPALVTRLPLLGAVLNLTIPDNDLTRSFDAKLRKTSLETLLTDLVRARARTTPLLFVLEDCHWLDPLSRDLIDAIGRAVSLLPVMMILTYRPGGLASEHAQRLAGLPHFAEIELKDFTPEEAERLILLKLSQSVDCDAGLCREAVDRVVARAQGNPFYIEELLNYLQERNVDLSDSRGLAALDLPASLHSLILSRIDRLGENERVTLRVASVIGRLFTAFLLRGAYPEAGTLEDLLADLAALTRLELILLDSEPELAYLFKHVVTQEVAYESMPYATRARLHEQVGGYIEGADANAVNLQLNLLAYHYDRSENLAKKREYLVRAGEAAQAAYANAAAVDYYQRALPWLSPAEQVPVMRNMGLALELSGRYRNARTAYEEAMRIASEINDGPSEARCQAALGEMLRKLGELPEAVTWLAQAQAGFEALGDRAGLAQCYHYSATVQALQGNLERAEELYRQGLDIQRELGNRAREASLLSNLSIVARWQGNYPEADALQEESLAIRRELGDRWAIANSLINKGQVLLDQSEYTAARPVLEEAVALQRELGDPEQTIIGLNNLANATRGEGDYVAARSLYSEALTTARDLGQKVAAAYLLEDMGVLAGLEGQPARGLRIAGAARALREAAGIPLPPADQAAFDRQLAPVLDSVPEAERDGYLAEGQAMSLEQAIEYALAEGQGLPQDGANR